MRVVKRIGPASDAAPWITDVTCRPEIGSNL
jgi:hypothetical protein